MRNARLPDMRNRVLLLILLAPLTLLAACPTLILPSDAPAPVEITEGEDLARFPEHVGAYRRGKMVMFEPEMRNYGIGYDRYDSKVQSSVTLFILKSPKLPLEDQFASEKSEILRAHSGAVLLPLRRDLRA